MIIADENIMKILFLHPPWPGKGFGLRSQNRWPRKRGDKTNRYPVLLCYAATLLKKEGHDVSYIDAVIQDFDEKKTIEEIKARSPDVIFIETATPTFEYDACLVNTLKDKFPETKIILAGSHVTFDPVGSLEKCSADVIVKGEMDYTTRNVITAFEKNKPLDEIKGICFRRKEKIVNNPTAALIEKLDDLPFPDRNLIPHQWYTEGHVKETPFTFVMASRGCPNHCTYCLWPNVYTEHRARYRSIKNVVDELEWLVREYGMKEIFFDDDTLNTTTERVIELCKEMDKRHVKLLWACSARVDRVNEEMLGWMKKTGCKLICYGAESASQDTLNKIQKGITTEQIKNAVNLTKKAKITVHLNFMLGFPWETRQDIQDTINFAILLSPDTVQFSLVFPHPGSKLYYEARDKGYFYDDVVGNWKIFDMTSGPILKTGVPREELADIVSRAHARFFLRPRYILEQVLKINSFSELKRMMRAGKSVVKGKILFKGKMKK